MNRQKLSFEDKLANYARLLVEKGINVQPGEFVQINLEPHAEPVARLAAQYAYERGARHVHFSYSDPAVTFAKLMNVPQEDRHLFLAHELARQDQIVDVGGCSLDLRTGSAPELAEKEPQRMSAYHNAMWSILRSRYRSEGLNKGRVAWCVAYPSSPGAARQIFEKFPAHRAHEHYWDMIFRMTFADQSDCLARWAEIDAKLGKRRKMLDKLRIARLRFKGPGTDFSVGLSSRAIWQGGSKKTALRKPFMANVPTYEVFTTPDWRQTEGRVRVTRPIVFAGGIVNGLELVFQSGRITYAGGPDAKQIESYLRHIDTDTGARQLGEVALVGLDSPIAQEKRQPREILYAENAACHIATGSAYTSCLRNGWDMPHADLEGLGCNFSSTHLDVMISDENVDVTAVTAARREVPLLRGGHWVEEFQ